MQKTPETNKSTEFRGRKLIIGNQNAQKKIYKTPVVKFDNFRTPDHLKKNGSASKLINTKTPTKNYINQNKKAARYSFLMQCEIPIFNAHEHKLKR